MKIHAAARITADDNGDKERLDQLVTQIQDIEQDVKEIEEDGDDATFERKHLEKLRDEQRRLKEKMGIGISARLQRLAARRTGTAVVAASGKSMAKKLLKALEKSGWEIDDKQFDTWHAKAPDQPAVTALKKVAATQGWEWDKYTPGLVSDDNHDISLHVRYVGKDKSTVEISLTDEG